MELVIKQEDLRAQLSRTKVNFKKSPKDRLTLQHLDTRIKLVEQKWEQFNKTHDQILDKIEQLRDTNYFTEGVYEETEEFYIEFISELKGIYEKLLKASNTSEKLEKQQNLTTSASIKLPKISIPAFSGLYTEWMSFRDMFMSLIHTNRNLDDVQKMHYLKSHLSGEAELLLRHIPVTKDNYEQSWNLLVKRYNNKQYLANCILKRFFGLRNVNNESSAALKELLDVTTDTLNALKNLNIDVKSWDVIVIYIVSLKLDQESRKLWEAEVSKSVTNTENLPTLDQFFEFLQNRYHSLEFMDTKLSGNKYYNNNYSSKTHAVQTLHVSHEVSCAFCKGSHRISSCKEFINKDCDTKRNFVQENGLCFNCLAGNHSAKQCRSLTSCFICRKRHHTLLHMKNVTAMNTVGSTEADAEQEVLTGTQSPTALTVSLQNNEQNIASLTSTASVQTVLLATALVKASSVYGNYQLLRSLVDQGSQASFITEAAAQLLGLKRTATSTAVAGLGGDKSIVSKSMVTVSIQSLHDPSYIIQVRAFILDKLTAHLPSITLEVASWPELEQIKLADPNYNTPNKIDILLGADVYGQIIKEGLIKYPSGSPIAQNTSLGWILSGQTRQTSGKTIVSMHVQVDELLKLFWETEKEPLTNKKIMTEEENKCEEMFKATTRRDEEGRYIVRLPFRNDNPACLKGHSRSIAMKMFFNRERKLQNNPTLKEEYIKTFNEYTELNHMEAVPEDESYSKKENCFYIPYHEVIREDRTTTKVRVVFHASMKGTNGVSLNDDLMVGPSLQSELRHLIMRWRVYPIVFTADVVKMYRQIKVDEKDADFQRIIWRDDPQKKLEEHRMLRLTFGTASAPYLAVRCLMQVAIDEAKDFPIAAEIVKRDFYMDDLMSGCFTENESIVLYEQISEMLRRGGFILQKWITNSEKLIQRIQDTKEDAVKKFEIKLEEKNKILGLIWNRKNDEFEYAVQLMQVSSPVTKRKVIADIARLYDPIGWIAPTVIKAKILIQKIWLSGITWDQELPPDLLHEWLNYRNDITNLTKIRIPRWLNRQLDDSLIELHGFCDASNEAYAAVVYTRVIDAQGGVHVTLVTAKTKVAPIKQISIPRLELSGAVLVTKLLIEVSELLNIPKANIRAWTESEIVLAWLSSHPSKWKTYVANRVSEIVSHLERSHWAHVPSEQNPADCASRGIAPSEIIRNTMWFNGPDWLKNKILNCETKLYMQTNLEEKIQKIKTHAAVAKPIDNTIWLKFSSLKKLLRVVAYCRRVLKNNRKNHTYLIKEEIEDALNIMIKRSQIEGFNEELKHICEGKEVKKKSTLTSYNPYIDELGILRVGGRLERADIKEESKHPILIPHSSFLAKLLVAEAHERTLHGGPLLMLTYLRSKYWILGAKNLVKFYFRKCIICIRNSASNKPQLMGQLPYPRANKHRAFLHCGIDYAGPIHIRISKGRGNRSYKGYICLFICLSTKAIHLEAVSDLSSNGFLAAYKRFVARRGHCSDLYSDNGSNFVGAARELKILFDREKSNFISEIVDWLASKECKWHFIPPYSPNFGGLWEAGIKSTKHHLRRVVGNSTLTFEEMTTMLAQVEACLNSRPMSYIEDQGEIMPLTPGHFLIGEPLVLAPDRSYELSAISSLRRWQLCQRMLQDFWRRWSQEYLTRFMQRYRWTRVTPEPNIGDVVLVQEPDLPPAKWLLGRVIEKHPGLDKITRVVTLKYKNSFIKRSISKICVLPVSE